MSIKKSSILSIKKCYGYNIQLFISHIDTKTIQQKESYEPVDTIMQTFPDLKEIVYALSNTNANIIDFLFKTKSIAKKVQSLGEELIKTPENLSDIVYCLAYGDEYAIKKLCSLLWIKQIISKFCVDDIYKTGTPSPPIPIHTTILKQSICPYLMS